MLIHLVPKDDLEAQGIRWVLESHLSGIDLRVWDNIRDFLAAIEHGSSGLAIINMDSWDQFTEEEREELKNKRLCWLGISSERIFQTAYRALKYRGEDVLFRPFSSSELIRAVQQIRYELRNRPEQGQAGQEPLQESGYPDLFVSNGEEESGLTVAAYLTPDSSALEALYRLLRSRTSAKAGKVFALSEFVLFVRTLPNGGEALDEYHSFMADWKKSYAAPLAVIVYQTRKPQSLKETYQHIRMLTKLIFFEGYDIIISENHPSLTKEMDPLLTPVEQREWIEMLEKRDVKAIRSWCEREFLALGSPYPDPELVRVRLTSVLAQVRRYMKTYKLQSEKLEGNYHRVFQKIVHLPTIHEIVNELEQFTALLFVEYSRKTIDPVSASEIAEELIESNYWNEGWNLSDCAESLGIHKSTLSRRFAAEKGLTFRDRLHQIRIREAKRLLLETDLPIERIAGMCGYSHLSYFSSKFKSIASSTPASYRRKSKYN
ncbi:helix-turn-helix domain-containing protein [Bacillus infantis]|uniref:response regulator transcription factor n=1 Tax=Bacillus infantis TaxID=324767 RepID=UPI001CD38821|nr:helix-turn-helix domain-containing protein [Bacillus infantis]MCA1042345.1 helix-turn-helix domain-containing protein [Bacillus infantis]